MIFDYYNIICPDCNKRLTNTSKILFFFKINCNCENIMLFLNKKSIIFYRKGRMLFIIRFNDIDFKSSKITVNETLFSVFRNLSTDKLKEARDYYINKPYLSEVYNEFMKIIKTYNNNLIFL